MEERSIRACDSIDRASRPTPAFAIRLAFAVFAAIAGAVVCANGTAMAAEITGELRQWHRVEIGFDGPAHAESDSSPNPFLDFRLRCSLEGPSGRSFEVPGFFDTDGSGGASGGVWKCRFSPDVGGTWQYTASFRSGPSVAVSPDAGAGASTAFDGESGSFTVAASDKSAPDFRAAARGLLRNRGGHYLTFADGEAWVKGGTNVPENLLGYSGFDNTPSAHHGYPTHVADWNVGDPDWNGGSGRAIVGLLNYLSSAGANSIYFLPMNVGGDGNDTYPTLSPQDHTHYDTSKLAQWETVFTHADRRGIFLHVQLSEAEQSNATYHDGGELGDERKLFYRELVARFGHHLGIEWDIGEENTYGTARREAFAAYIASVDPYDHPITTHTRFDELSQYYAPLLGNAHFAMTAFQMGHTNLATSIVSWRQQSAAAGVPWVISLDEPHPIENDANDNARGYPSGRRNFLWPVYLSGGGGFEWYVKTDGGGDTFDFTVEDLHQLDPALEWTGHALAFLAELPLAAMSPSPGLSSADFTLAEVGNVYALYDRGGGSLSVNLSGASGEFRVRWFNPRTGVFQAGTSVSGGATRSIGSAPFGDDIAAIVERVGNAGCQGTSDCSDGNTCNGTESCVAGACVAGAPLQCDDGEFCNGVESCDPVAGCRPGAAPACDDGIDCTDDTCNESAEGCVHARDDGDCNDGDVCNGAESCSPEAGCVAGVPLSCDDGVSCTTDVCSPPTGACEHVAFDSLCNDGLACNGTETCDATRGCAAGTSPNCNDGVGCTADYCLEATTGCVHRPIDIVCDDGNACNGVETCRPATGCEIPAKAACDDGLACNGIEACDATAGCVPGVAPDCDDGVFCTADACLESVGGCRNIAFHMLCDDGDVCNGIDICDVTEGCVAGEVTACDDGLFCNGTETCDPLMGCRPATAPLDCNDGVGCTADTCIEAAGGCKHFPFHLVCDDAVTCNGLELCDLDDGCVAGPPPTCDDGLFCNGTETCAEDRGCVDGTPPDCNDGIACTVDACSDTDGCTHTADVTSCDDGAPCTDDVCSGTQGCTTTFNVAPCDDGVACTGNDRCSDGTCTGTSLCSPGLSCEAGTGACVGPSDPDADGLFGDADPCPDDARNRCFGPVAVDAGESRLLRLNVGDVNMSCGGPRIDCRGLAWGEEFGGTGATATGCDASEPGCAGAGVEALFGCEDTETLDLVRCGRTAASNEPGIFYTFDVGPGVHVVNLLFMAHAAATERFDILLGMGLPSVHRGFDPATIAPTGEVVVRSAVVEVSGRWLDLALLPAAGAASIAAIEVRTAGAPSTTLSSSTTLLVTTTSLAATTTTAECVAALDCDDGNACNGSELCTAGTCAPGTPPQCDDGLLCNGLETCDPSLGCTSGPEIVCEDGIACTSDRCDEGATGCIFIADHTKCDDSHACTLDACDAGAGCTHTPTDGLPCEDGDPCSIDDACIDGICTPGRPLDCTLLDTQCLEAACDPAGICTAEPRAGAPCDDGNACTASSECDGAGQCVGSIAAACADGDPCTEDACDAGDGCVHAPVACDDGSVCTIDSCDAASGCVHTIVSCNDGVGCTADICDDELGCFIIPDDELCDDGLFCTGPEICIATAGCLSIAGPSCDDGLECTVDLCDPAVDACTHDAAVSVGARCGDGAAGTCTAAGTCQIDDACPGRFVDVIDFDDLPAGMIVGRIDAAGGTGPIEVFADNDRLRPANAALLYDSSCAGGCSSGDDDLGTPHADFGGPGIGVGGAATAPYPNDVARGNILVVAQNLIDANGDGLVDAPNDQGDRVSTVQFDFAAVAPVVVTEVTLVDVDSSRPAPVLDLFSGSGVLVESIVVPTGGNNSVVPVRPAGSGPVRTLVLTLSGSGALDTIVFSTGDCATPVE